MEIALILVGLVFGLILMYFVLRPKLKRTQQYDYQTEEQNRLLREQRDNYEKDIVKLEGKHLAISEEVSMKKNEYEHFVAMTQEVKKNRANLIEEIDKNNEVIYQKSFDLMQEKLSQAAEVQSSIYQQASQEAEAEYLSTLEDWSQYMIGAIEVKREELAKVEEQLAQMKAKADAAIAAAKREEEKLLEIDKYKILVTDLDLLEINRLREIAPYFRNARAIYKIIWESYYRNNTTDLINRVIGAGTHTGIYKLTNLKNQKVYIGQAANLADRWKDHIKAGLGIDTPNNMLYTAMLKDGVENFTFEVLEECERSALNDRETYYIEFYRSQEHGYNMTKGGARK